MTWGYLLNKYLLSTYYILRILLSTRDTDEHKTDKMSYLMQLTYTSK